MINNVSILQIASPITTENTIVQGLSLPFSKGFVPSSSRFGKFHAIITYLSEHKLYNLTCFIIDRLFPNISLNIYSESNDKYTKRKNASKLFPKTPQTNLNQIKHSTPGPDILKLWFKPWVRISDAAEIHWIGFIGDSEVNEVNFLFVNNRFGKWKHFGYYVQLIKIISLHEN